MKEEIRDKEVIYTNICMKKTNKFIAKLIKCNTNNVQAINIISHHHECKEKKQINESLE